MRINLDYLKKFIDHNYERQELKEILASIGIEVDEIMVVDGSDVFEVEITPNRPDWLSHYGIAREIYAKNPSLKLNSIKTDRKNSTGKSNFHVEIADLKACPRYSGAIINNIKVTESSALIKKLIESFGLRPVNNIVDISNIITMTYGHPIHIFDVDTLKGEKVIIRRAHKGERLTLLDGGSKEFDENDLMIADGETSVAVAGIMGGDHSGVKNNTVNIFIECAWFEPLSVRKTSKKLGIKTDASYLFERGADIGNTEEIIDLTIDLILKEVGGTPEIVSYFDEYPVKADKQVVKLNKDFPEKFTGIKIDESISSRILSNLGFVLEDNAGYWNVEVPSFRVDINGYEDLVEEIIRIYGYDKLETIIPGTVADSVEWYEKRFLLDNIRSYFNSLGYSEVINYSFHSLKDNSFFGEDSENVEIRNPIGSDFSVMRNSLLSGILKNTATNRNNDFKRISLMESGTVFQQKGEKLIEKDVVCFSASGFEILPNWKEGEGRKFDFFLFKSQIFSYLKRMGLSINIRPSAGFKSFLKEECCFSVLINGMEAGFIGEIKDLVLEYYKNDEPVYVSQLDMDILSGSREERKFEAWNRLPASTRDLSFLIDQEKRYELIRTAIDKYKPESLEDYSLSGLYEGKGIPAGKISMLMNFRYRSDKRTLTADEVNEIHDSLTEKLIRELGITRR